MNLSREIGELKSQLANVGSEKEALIAERDSLQHELNKLVRRVGDVVSMSSSYYMPVAKSD